MNAKELLVKIAEGLDRKSDHLKELSAEFHPSAQDRLSLRANLLSDLSSVLKGVQEQLEREAL